MTRLYLDTDIFLAIIKDDDRHKKAAQNFFQMHKSDELITSTITCLEIWFYLYKQGLGEKALDAIRAVGTLCTIQEVPFMTIQEAILLAQEIRLSPADGVHAVLASSVGVIVSSDHAFKRITGLQQIDFSNV